MIIVYGFILIVIAIKVSKKGNSVGLLSDKLNVFLNIFKHTVLNINYKCNFNVII